MHPFKARRITKTHTKHYFFAIHFTSCVLMIPYVGVLRLEGSDCRENWPAPVSRFRKAFSLVLFLVQHGIPLTLMVTLHSFALRTLRGTSSYMKPQRNGIQRIERSQSELSAMNLLGRKRSKKFKSRRCLLAVIVFSLSTFPNQVLWLWVDFGNGKDSDYFAIIPAVC